MRPGPRGSHPSGIGHITAKGYHRAVFDGRQRLVHDVVWEREHGPIPDGFEVHHRSGDKLDNDPGNLELLTHTDHKREHSEHYRRNDAGEWERDCNRCGGWFPATAEHFYLSREGWPLYGRCRPCHIRVVVEAKRQRRLDLS